MRKHAIVTMALAIALTMPAITSAGPMSDFAAESSEKEYTFRGIPWGSSLEQVKNSDFLLQYSDYVYDPANNDIAVQDVKVAGKTAGVILYFGYKGLYSAGYIFDKEEGGISDDYQTFLDVEKSLKKKYGDPDEKKDDFASDVIKNTPSMYALSISMGKAVFLRKWIGEDTELWLATSGSNGTITNILIYQSNTLSPEETEIDDGL